MSFSVSKDINYTKSAIEQFVEEFNGTQQYITSLTVVQDGENVSSATFTGNTRKCKLTSQLRKIVFGSTTPHSESGRTSDGTNLVINANDASNTEINNVATQLGWGQAMMGISLRCLTKITQDRKHISRGRWYILGFHYSFLFDTQAARFRFGFRY